MDKKHHLKIDFYPVKIRGMVDSWQERSVSIDKIDYSNIDFQELLKKLKESNPKRIANRDVFFTSKEKRILAAKLLEVDKNALLDKASTLFEISPDKFILQSSIKYFMNHYSNPKFNKYLNNCMPKIKLPDNNWEKWLSHAESLFSDDVVPSLCSKVVKEKIYFEKIEVVFGLVPNSVLFTDVLKKLFSLNLINYLQIYDPLKLIKIIQTEKYGGILAQIINAAIHAYYDQAMQNRQHHFYNYVKRNYKNPDEFAHLWVGISKNGREKFKEWLIGWEIEDFFKNIAGDELRLSYWRKQIKYISSAKKVSRKYDDNPCCLVMRIKKYEFFEFPQKGNALYIYKTDSLPYRGKVSSESALKDKNKVVVIHSRRYGTVDGRVIHIGQWTNKVDEFITAAGK